jgi:hypothetical protein
LPFDARHALKAARLVSIANANNLLPPPRAITNFQKMLPAKLSGDFARHIGNAD